MSLSDLQSLKRATYLKMSPDGRSLAYVEDGEIWLISTKERSTPRRAVKGDDPLWSPDGKRIAYTSKESGSLQVWILNFNTGKTERITDFKGGIDPDPLALHIVNAQEPIGHSWSPDGKRLAFTSQVVSPALHYGESTGVETRALVGKPLVLTNNTPPGWTLTDIFKHANLSASYDVRGNSKLFSLDPPKANQIFIADISSRKITQLTIDQKMYFDPDWSPDGRQIVCISTEGKAIHGYTAGTTNIYTIDVLTAQQTKIRAGSSEKWLPHWSPDGSWIAFLDEGFGMKLSVSVVAARDGDGTTEVISPDNWSASWGSWLEWGPDSRSIAINYLEGISTSIARCDISSRACVKVAVEEGSSNRLLTASRLGSLAWLQSTGTVASVIRVLPVGAVTSYALLDLNPQVKDWQLGRQELVRWKNRHGDERTGVLVKPAGYQQGQKFPLIVDGYPDLANVIYGPMSANQALASQGYGIFYPNPRMPHYWVAYSNTRDQQLAKGPAGLDVLLDDVTSGVDELVGRGIVDSDRMCLYGFSNGGAVVNQLVTMTGMFKCAVSVAGAISADWSLPVFLMSDNRFIPYLAGKTPWEDPETYIKLSALYRLDKVTTPVLLADGDNDFGFLLGSVEMYNGLRYLGKDVTFLRYANQGHGFEGAALQDFWKRENAFFAKYLKPQE